MIHFAVGFLSAFAVVIIFRLFNRKAILEKQPTLDKTHYLYFFTLCICSAFILQSYEQPWIWIGFLILCYTCLEDFHQSSFHIGLPIWLSLCFYFLNGNPYSVLWVFAFFALFFIFDNLWSKYISENFDIIFLFPLTYLCFFDKNEWIAFAIFLLLIAVSMISKDAFIGQGDAYFALPILYFLELDAFISFFLMACFIAMPFAVHQFLFKEKSDFAFAPYLLGGFILTYANHGILSLIVVVTAILSSFLLWVLAKIKNRGA